MELTRSEKASILFVSLISGLIALANVVGLASAGVDQWQEPMFSAAFFGYITTGMVLRHRAAPILFTLLVLAKDGAILFGSHMNGSAAIGTVVGSAFVLTFGVVSARGYFRIVKKHPAPQKPDKLAA